MAALSRGVSDAHDALSALDVGYPNHFAFVRFPEGAICTKALVKKTNRIDFAVNRHFPDEGRNLGHRQLKFCAALANACPPLSAAKLGGSCIGFIPSNLNKDIPNPWPGVTMKTRVKLAKPTAKREQVYAFAHGCIERGEVDLRGGGGDLF